MATACVAVAYSGGRDSTALLHATMITAQTLGLGVVALHVHHRLSPNADDWLLHCERQCVGWRASGLPVRFVAERVTGTPQPGDSIEAWARRARYRSLRRMALANHADVVLLAHHRRDQAETFLLQALRGAGVAGLAGMPRSVLREGVTWLRPWLDRPRDDIEAYVHYHRLDCIEDESNRDSRFARSRLRVKVWKELVDAYPQAEISFAAAADWAHEAQAALAELAVLDLHNTVSARGLERVPWALLSRARRSNALRSWMKLQTGSAPPATLVARLFAEWHVSGSARWPVAGGEFRAHRGCLSYVAATGHTRAAVAKAPPVREASLRIRRPGSHSLPGWGGLLEVTRVKEGGVPLAWLAELALCERKGAEQFQAAIGRPPRSLKKQFQAAGVPAWERSGPLIYSGGQLVYVPGLGLDARVIGPPGQALLRLRWVSPTDEPEPAG